VRVRARGCVALFIQQALRWISIMSFVASLAPPYFSTLSHKLHDFLEKVFFNKKIYIFGFPLQLLRQTFMILRRIQRDLIIKVHTS
jgi:hypothetical protein